MSKPEDLADLRIGGNTLKWTVSETFISKVFLYYSRAESWQTTTFFTLWLCNYSIVSKTLLHLWLTQRIFNNRFQRTAEILIKNLGVEAKSGVVFSSHVGNAVLESPLGTLWYPCCWRDALDGFALIKNNLGKYISFKLALARPLLMDHITKIPCSWLRYFKTHLAKATRSFCEKKNE